MGTNKWKFFSPLREEKNASGSLEFRGDNVLIYDQGHGEGSGDAILQALGLTWPDVLPARAEAPASSGQRIYYDYLDESGKLLYQAVRILTADGKTFRQRRPDGEGGWIWNLQNTRRVLYRLPELLAASPDRLVYVPEGEKDCDNLRAVGEIATTNPQGAGKWRPEYAEALRGRHVVVLPDNDEPGRKHGEDVARLLRGVAASIKVVLLPGLRAKGDVSDWLAAGHTAEELRALVEAAPLFDATKQGQGETVTADAVLSSGQDGHRPPRAFALTETGGAELFADRLTEDWHYCEDRKQWIGWSSGRWAFDPGDVAITERSKLVAQEFLAEAQWALKADDARAKAFAQFAATAQRRQFRRAIIDLARSEPGILIPFADFDRDAFLLNFVNGTLSLRTGELRPHSREDPSRH
jgi:putative DNA primase/helicase